MVIIFGPTAVGKTDFAENIAQHIPAEIVNMDLGQFYTPLSIGTAKPDWRHSTIAHHLFDLLDTPQDFTVATYREVLLKTLSGIWARGNLPIIVGGSAFYLQSIFFPPSAPTGVLDDPHEDDSWELLYSIDPARAEAIDKNDQYRIQRALNIWRSTGNKPSEYSAVYEAPCSYDLFFLTRDREQLYERIDKRVLAMMDAGLLKEVADLKDTEWETFLCSKKLIGYDDLLSYLKSDEQTDEQLARAIAIIQRRTRNYAKRQHTFWRMLEKKIARQGNQDKEHTGHMQEVDLTTVDSDIYCKQLAKRLSQ